MIDMKGQELYKTMMDLLCPKEDVLTEAQRNAMVVFDNYMNSLNHTTRVLYSKSGEVLMKC
jgi:hypothetical protein